MTKLWHIMENRDRKNLNVDKDVDDIIGKMKQIGWNETTRFTGFSRQEEDADQ